MNHCLNFLYHFMVSSLKLWHLSPTFLPTHLSKQESLLLSRNVWPNSDEFSWSKWWIYKIDTILSPTRNYGICKYITYAFAHTIGTKNKIWSNFGPNWVIFSGSKFEFSKETCYGNITGSKLCYVWKILRSKHFKHQGFSVSTYTLKIYLK